MENEDNVIIKTMAQDINAASDKTQQGLPPSNMPIGEPRFAPPIISPPSPPAPVFGDSQKEEISYQKPASASDFSGIDKTAGMDFSTEPRFPNEPPTFSQNMMPDAESEKKFPLWAFLLIGLVIAVAIGGALYFFVKLFGANNSPTPVYSETPVEQTPLLTPTPVGQIPQPIFTKSANIFGINSSDYGNGFTPLGVILTTPFSDDFTEIRVLTNNQYLLPFDSVASQLINDNDSGKLQDFVSQLGQNWLIFYYKPKGVAGLVLEIKDPMSMKTFMQTWEIDNLQNAFDPLLLGNDKGTSLSTIFQDGTYNATIPNRYFRFSSNLNLNYAIYDKWLVVAFDKDAFFSAMDYLTGSK